MKFKLPILGFDVMWCVVLTLHFRQALADEAAKLVVVTYSDVQKPILTFEDAIAADSFYENRRVDLQIGEILNFFYCGKLKNGIIHWFFGSLIKVLLLGAILLHWTGCRYSWDSHAVCRCCHWGAGKFHSLHWSGQLIFFSAFGDLLLLSDVWIPKVFVGWSLFVCIFWWLNSKDKSLWFQETGIVRNLWLDFISVTGTCLRHLWD